MQCVMVPDSRFFKKHVANHDATLLLKSLTDFEPQLFGLPPYDTE